MSAGWLTLLGDAPLTPQAAASVITVARAADEVAPRRWLACRPDADPATLDLLAGDPADPVAWIALDRLDLDAAELAARLAGRDLGSLNLEHLLDAPGRVLLAVIELLDVDQLAAAVKLKLPRHARLRALARLSEDAALWWPRAVAADALAPLLPPAACLYLAENGSDEAVLRTWARPLLARIAGGDAGAYRRLCMGLDGFGSLLGSFTGWLLPQVDPDALDDYTLPLLQRTPSDVPDDVADRWALARCGSAADPAALSALAQLACADADEVLGEELAANPATPADAVVAVVVSPHAGPVTAGLALAVHGADPRVRLAALAAEPALLAIAPPAPAEAAALGREVLAARRALPLAHLEGDLAVCYACGLRGADLLGLPAGRVLLELADAGLPADARLQLQAALLDRLSVDPSTLLTLCRLAAVPADLSVAGLLDLVTAVAAPAS